jgi:hypothetical protein
MTQEIGRLVFRIIPIENLPYDLEHGLFSKNSAPDTKTITSFYSKIDDLINIDWTSIKTTDFRNDNADGDVDRIRYF